MSLLDALHGGIAAANLVTKSLQATVMLEHCIGRTQYGPSYAPAVPLACILDERQQQVRTKSGELTASRCKITFLDILAVVAATAPDGRILDVDVLTLPDGSKGSILSVGGFDDPVTGHPVVVEVAVG